MDEHQSATSDDAHGSQVEATGMPSVDDVLEQMARLADLPVSEHVGVFERAHDQLRRALDAQPDA